MATRRAPYGVAGALLALILVAGGPAAAGGGDKDLSVKKLAALDYSPAVLDTSDLALLSPQLAAAVPGQAAINPGEFGPQVCAELPPTAENIIAGDAFSLETVGGTSSAFSAAYSFKSTKIAKKYLKEIAGFAKGCADFPLGDYTLTAAEAPDLPKVGDQSAVLRASTVLGGVPINVLQLFVREGQFIGYANVFTIEDITDDSVGTETELLADGLGELR